MSNKLRQLKQQGKIAGWWDFRGNSLLDKSGNDLTTTVSGDLRYVNLDKGRGIESKGGSLIITNDSALNGQEGILLAFGEFPAKSSTARFFSKRVGATIDWIFAYDNSNWVSFNDNGAANTAQSDSLDDDVKTYMVGCRFSNGSGVDFFRNGSLWGTDATAMTLASGRTQNLYLMNWSGGSFPMDEQRYSTQYVFINDSTVTDEDIATIYNEYMQERGVLEQPRRGFISNIPKGDEILYWDMDTRQSGKIADLTSGGNDGTINNAISKPNFTGGGMDFNGVNSCLQGTLISEITRTGTYTIELLVKPRDVATTTGGVVVQNTLASNDRNGIRIHNNEVCGGIYDGASWIGVSTAITNNKWAHVVYTCNVGALALYLDGVAATGSSEPYSSSYGGISLGMTANNKNPFDGEIAYFKVYDYVLTQAQAQNKYSQIAKYPLFSHNLDDTPPTLANVTSGMIGKSEFTRETGTWKISEELSNDKPKKWIGCVGAGVACTPSTKAYGTWVFELNKGAATAPRLGIIASDCDAEGGATQNGYFVYTDSLERIGIRRITNGSATNIMYTNSGYYDPNTDYQFAFSRSYAGVFTLYIKGGAFTEWTLVDVTGGTGTNPDTDTTHTTSQYMSMDMDGTDKLRMLGVHEGVLSIGELEELY